MAYIDNPKSYEPRTLVDIAKRRNCYVSDVQDSLVEFTRLYPEADVQEFLMSDDDKMIEEGLDVLFKTNQGIFILRPDGDFEIAENGRRVRTTRKVGKSEKFYATVVFDALKNIDISEKSMRVLYKQEWSVIVVTAYELFRQCQLQGKHGYGEEFQMVRRALEWRIQNVLNSVQNLYDIVIEAGWTSDEYIRELARDSRVKFANTDHQYIIFIPYAE